MRCLKAQRMPRKAVWRDARVEVTCAEQQDQLALDYAVWHLTTMTPAHSERSSIAAKGLTGGRVQRARLLGYRNFPVAVPSVYPSTDCPQPAALSLAESFWRA